jgi:hypothetical protein
MVRRAYRQRSLIEVLLPDADKLWDPTLRRIDALKRLKPIRRGSDAVSRRILQHRRASLDFPAVPPADGAMEQGPFICFRVIPSA